MHWDSCVCKSVLLSYDKYMQCGACIMGIQVLLYCQGLYTPISVFLVSLCLYVGLLYYFFLWNSWLLLQVLSGDKYAFALYTSNIFSQYLPINVILLIVFAIIVKYLTQYSFIRPSINHNLWIVLTIKPNIFSQYFSLWQLHIS